MWRNVICESLSIKYSHKKVIRIDCVSVYIKVTKAITYSLTWNFKSSNKYTCLLEYLKSLKNTKSMKTVHSHGGVHVGQDNIDDNENVTDCY